MDILIQFRQAIFRCFRHLPCFAYINCPVLVQTLSDPGVPGRAGMVERSRIRFHFSGGSLRLIEGADYDWISPDESVARKWP